MPIEADRNIPLAEHYVSNTWIWKPTKEQERLLQLDWKEVTNKIISGEQAEIAARDGKYQ